MPLVSARLHDPVPGVVEVAGEALHRFGPGALGPLRRIMADPDPHLRELAARALGRVGQDWPGEAEAMAARCLAVGCGDAQAAVRREAYQALAGMPGAEATDRLLAEGLADPEPELRIQVASLLGRRSDNPRALMALARALPRSLAADSEPLALALLAALGKHGRDAQAVIAPLARAARAGPPRVRTEALKVILAADASSDRVLKLLAERLADRAPEVRVVAVRALGKRLPVEIKMHPRDKRLRRLADRIRRMAVQDPDAGVRRVCRSVDVRLPG